MVGGAPPLGGPPPPWRGLWASSTAQIWWHSCCSLRDLQRALEDLTITAIESDVVYSPSRDEEVMAHPPVVDSDLTFGDFMETCAAHEAVRHLKLDFKERRVVGPCLRTARRYEAKLKERGQALWLNADVLAGPGCASSKFDADDFVRACKEQMPDAALSLGWRVDLGVGGSYEKEHVDAMIALLRRHRLLEEGCRTRVVVTANLRLAVFDSEKTHLARVLEETPCELLLWTGFGEPPISQADLDEAVRLFDLRDADDRRRRVGFDVHVASSPSWALAANAAFRIFRIYAFVKEKSSTLASHLIAGTANAAASGAQKIKKKNTFFTAEAADKPILEPQQRTLLASAS